MNTLTRLIDTTQNAVHSADNMRLHTSTHCTTPALLTPPLLLLLLLLLLLMVMVMVMMVMVMVMVMVMMVMVMMVVMVMVMMVMVMSVLTLAAAVMQQKNSGPEWFAFVLC